MPSKLKRFVKPAVISAADSPGKLMKIDITPNGSSCLQLKAIDVGFGAQKELAASGVSDIRKMKFREDCRKFLTATVNKIFERSPMKYGIVRAISSLSPKLIIQSPTLASSRMKTLLQFFADGNIINVLEADRAKNQFSEFLMDSEAKEALQNFREADAVLDEFYYALLGTNYAYDSLWPVVRKSLIIFHGNASVESGFSINGDILVPNLQESSVVAQRMVYDGLKAGGGILKLQVDKAMQQSVRTARGRYRDALESRKQAASAELTAANVRKRAAAEVQALKAKKRQMEVDAEAARKTMELQIKELEKVSRQ